MQITSWGIEISISLFLELFPVLASVGSERWKKLQRATWLVISLFSVNWAWENPSIPLVLEMYKDPAYWGKGPKDFKHVQLQLSPK